MSMLLTGLPPARVCPVSHIGVAGRLWMVSSSLHPAATLVWRSLLCGFLADWLAFSPCKTKAFDAMYAPMFACCLLWAVLAVCAGSGDILSNQWLVNQGLRHGV